MITTPSPVPVIEPDVTPAHYAAELESAIAEGAQPGRHRRDLICQYFRIVQRAERRRAATIARSFVPTAGAVAATIARAIEEQPRPAHNGRGDGLL